MFDISATEIVAYDWITLKVQALDERNNTLYGLRLHQLSLNITTNEGKNTVFAVSQLSAVLENSTNAEVTAQEFVDHVLLSFRISLSGQMEVVVSLNESRTATFVSILPGLCLLCCLQVHNC